MISAIESSKHVHIAVLIAFWSGDDKAHVGNLLHGFTMLVHMDDEPEAYDEMVFLRELANEIDFGVTK